MGDSAGLDRAIQAFVEASPGERIIHRDDVLAFGVDAIAPLLQAAIDHPELAASVTSWLEHLAKTRQDSRGASEAALRRLASRADNDLAKAALARLTTSVAGTTTKTPVHRGKSAACAAVHQRLIDFAREGRTVYYSELGTSRGHIGKYLYQISRDEADAGRPPLTSLVVQKQTGHPGDGYILAMLEVGFAQAGEDVDDVWQRAKAAVFDYWRAH